MRVVIGGKKGEFPLFLMGVLEKTGVCLWFFCGGIVVNCVANVVI
jgi:hypothetical protein